VRPTSETATALSPEEFSGAFRSLWETLTSRFFKFEGRQTYAEPGDSSFEAFRRRELEEARRLVVERIAAQQPLYRSAASRGVQIVRVRRYELPLTPYLRDYELYGYIAGTEFGEEVLMVEASDADALGQLIGETTLPDFVLFDDTVVLVQDYDVHGRFQGARRIDDPNSVRVFVHVTKMLHLQALPLVLWVGIFAPMLLEAGQIPYSKVWQVEARAGSAKLAWARAQLDRQGQPGSVMGVSPGLIAALWRRLVPSVKAAAAHDGETQATAEMSALGGRRLRDRTAG
jgi:hypothetical protein